MEITTRTSKNGGYISTWQHGEEAGTARSTSPEQAEKNALRQAKRRGCDMTDYCGQPQGYGLTRRLYETV